MKVEQTSDGDEARTLTPTEAVEANQHVHRAPHAVVAVGAPSSSHSTVLSRGHQEHVTFDAGRVEIFVQAVVMGFCVLGGFKFVISEV